MLMHIDPADDRPIYQQIMDEVQRARVMGTLPSHGPLPSVRQLAGELRVNPNTVQQAYRELERQGAVYVKRGQGTFAAPLEAPSGARRRLLAEVAGRALRDAYRHGFSAAELAQAVRAANPERPRRGRKPA